MRRFVSGEFTFTGDELINHESLGGGEASLTDRGAKNRGCLACRRGYLARHEFELTMWRFDKHHEELRAANEKVKDIAAKQAAAVDETTGKDVAPEASHEQALLRAKGIDPSALE